MNEKTAMVIMRTFEKNRPTRSAVVTKAWRWAAGVHVFPEAICPFCKAVMVSTCLWWVGEQRLLSIVGFKGKRLVRMPMLHPHVRSDGYICMYGHAGRLPGASDVVDALFLAIYPASNMMANNRLDGIWEKWFNDYFGHIKHDAKGLAKRSRPSLATRLKVRKRVAD